MKLKRLLFGFGAAAMLVLASCDNSAGNTQSIISSQLGDNTQVTNPNPNTNTEPNTNTNAGTENDPVVSKRTKPTDLSTTSTLYIVGDSTVDEFLTEAGTPKDTTYFYERCGWGGHIKDYTEKLTIKNYGASGRSSKDYLGTSYYTDIKNNIKAGDYLMIGFGHNDEKSDDPTRFTDASKPITDNTSFQYSLYENYIKLAEDKGATPILCTPIVRLSASGDYTGSTAHKTATGDYRQAIVDLGTAKSVKVIDLTTYTKDLYTKIGYDEALYFHAITSGLSQAEPNLTAVDSTHINNYGAKYFDYYIAKELYNDSNCYLGNYVKDEITEPTKENDLKINSVYKYTPYAAPNLKSYSPANQFKAVTEGWYGTAFGDTGGDPNSSSNGYVAKETSAGVFEVGQALESGDKPFKGKMADKTEGIAFCFKQVSINDNFTFSVKAKVLKVKGDGVQDGFGIMLRDACWLPIKDSGILSNYVSAGIVRDGKSNVYANFSRSNLTAITYSSNTVSTYPKVDDVVEFKITRTGQSVVCETIIGSTTYTTNYLDFDFVAKDSDYFYVGMFGARGTVVEYTDVVYTKTGTSQGA